LEKELNDNDPIVLRLAEWDRWHRRFLAERTPFRFEKEDQWKINFVGSFAKFPSEKVFDFAKQNTPIAADNVFRDKIVLLGVSHRASHDFHLTPKGKMTGVEIHANAVHTILSRSQIRGAHRVAALAIAMMFALIASVLFTLYDPLAVKIASYVAIPVIALPVSYWSLVHAGIWLDLLTPLMAIRLASDIADFREQRLIKRTLGEFVDQEVAKHLVEEEDSLAHAQEVSVLFTNVRNLTTLAEQSRPAKAIAMMNQLFSMIDEVIKKYQGSIINFAGDGVFAVFGAPKANLSHARSAVQAALEIYDRTHALNRQWNERDLPSLKITVGIHTGEALAGVAGLGARKRYDVTGDTVSVGARVERLNEQFETSILVTEQTLKQLDAEVSVNECGEIKVVGDQRVKVFEVLQAPSQWRF
jgi:adenylate cyclase